MKGEKIIRGNHQGHAASATPANPSAPARKPSGIEPASPMNTRAGGKFHARNPTLALASAMHDAARDENVITPLDRHVSEGRFEGGLSGEEEEELQEPPLPQKSDKKPSGSQKAEKEPSRSQKSEKEGAPKKSLLDELVASIDKAFRQFDPERFKMRKKDEAFFDPVSENNCLITAINGGTAASADDVLMIRYLIFDQLDIPYGEFLPASPEVIYIIVKTLRIKPARIEIFMSGRRSAAQVFIVTGTYNVVELEGDEAERQEEEEDSKKIPITHSGGNHFSYRRGRGK